MTTTSPIALTTTLVRREGLFAAEVGDEIAMLNVERGRYYCLNVTAHAVWRKLEVPSRVPDICERLCDEFNVSRATCEQELIALLTEFLGEGLITVVECGS